MSLLLKEILKDSTLPDAMYDAEIRSVKFYKSDGHAEICVHTADFLSYSDYEDLLDELDTLLQMKTLLYIDPENCRIRTWELQKYLDSFAAANDRLAVYSNAVIRFEEADKKLIFMFADESDCAMGGDMLPKLQELLDQIGLKDLHTFCEMAVLNAAEIGEVSVPVPSENPAPAPEKSAKKKYYRPKPENYTELKLKDADTPIENIKFEGVVFNIENFEIRANKHIIQSLSVFDGEDAIIAKRFEGKLFSREEIDDIKEGERIRVYGNIVNDKYANDLVCEVTQMEKLDPVKITDPAEPKRIELHCHTNMSEMDAVCDAESVVKYAWNLGHRGIAITDHADVQSFVKAYNTASKLKKGSDREFKVILGCEVNAVNDQLTIVRNVTDHKLDDEQYVCFDLETTGLSAKYDSIIEFGAVRMKHGAVIDRMQMFIKPPFPIPAFISAKTNISNDMVKNAGTFAECADEILNWIGDDVLVAHNATFDYFFLNDELRRIGREPLKNTVIDTLDMSRAILKERRAYRLGNISRYYHIPYDEEVAHRADYDAEALAGVFQCLMKDANDLGAVTVRDLQDKIQDENAFKKVRRYHANLLAKNHAGLKDLYHLVTISNTKTLAVMGKSAGKEAAEVAAEARVLKKDIDAHRENLIVSAGCYNSELFEIACNGDDLRLEECMKWYDMIELQPLSNFTCFVAMGNVPDMNRVKQVQKRIIEMAQKLHIPVCATSDAHYCSPDQKMFRDVYIMSQGVGGAIHPLYIRDDALRYRTKNPDQHIRKTQEMLDEFAWLDDEQLVRKIVIEEPNRIFDMIEEVRPVPAGTFPPTIEGSDDKLRKICHDTAMRMYGFEGKVPEYVTNRLNNELDNIIRHGFGVHYYIAHLLVKKSNEDGYVVGSRGSVGSSFTATMSGITEVNPLAPHYLCPSCKYSEFIDDPGVKSGFDLPDKVCPHCGAIMKGNGHNIPFQTFLGFNADKTPDIDLNFSNEYQWRAHAFIKEVFGEDHAFRAGTIGTVAEKTAYGYVSGYCEKMNITNMRRPMRDYLAKGCQNVKRTTGQHPGGIIIIPEEYEAEDFTPVQYPANDPTADWKTTHYDFHDIHDNVLKFDILGHVDPTAMRLMQNIADVKPMDIPMNDPETLSLFYEDRALMANTSVYRQETGALGLPEFGTRTTRRVLEETRPHCFSDLVIISGLSHGTDVWSGNAQVLVQQGHPLSEVIGCRDDIMTYLLEKNLEPIDAFKTMEDVRKGRGLRPDQEENMKAHNVPDWYIDSCKKIKYMFPKAHAVAYVMMAVRIAWYKVHEPWNFYIQYLSLRCDAYEIETMTKDIQTVRNRMADIAARMDRFSTNPATNKERSLYDTLEVVEEMLARGYHIGNVDLYRSLATTFTVDPNDKKTIIPPFIVIDGLGANVARSIEEARKKGEFLSKEDILKRTQLSAALMRKLEVLGCLDGLQERNQISLF